MKKAKNKGDMMKRTIKVYSCSMAEWKQFINEKIGRAHV